MEQSPNPTTNKKPTLVVVHQGFDSPGGVSTSCLNQIAILLENYRIALITDQSHKDREDYPKELEIIRLRVPKLTWLHRLGHVPRQWAFIQMVKSHLQQYENSHDIAAVIFHSHPAAALLAKSLRKVGVRSILVVHGDIFERPAGTYGRQLTTWYRWATPRAYRRVDAIFSLSPAMQSLAQRWAEGNTQTYLVPNSIDPGEIGIFQSATACGMKADTTQDKTLDVIECDHTHLVKHHSEPAQAIPDLLFVGRIEPLKGVSNLLEAVAQLHQIGRAHV